jgi:hypothetical protein
MRLAAGIWLLLAIYLTLAFFAELTGKGRPLSLILAAGLALATGWTGARLWKRATRRVVLISACLGAFFVFFAVTAVAQGYLKSSTGIGLAAAGATAALVPLRDWERLP